MAGASSSNFSKDNTMEVYDEELDFFSAKFNPQRALFSPNVVIPYPDIKSFESIKSYEDAVKVRQQTQRHSHSKPNEQQTKELSDTTRRTEASISESAKEYSAAEKTSSARDRSYEKPHHTTSVKSTEKSHHVEVVVDESKSRGRSSSQQLRASTIKCETEKHVLSSGFEKSRSTSSKSPEKPHHESSSRRERSSSYCRTSRMDTSYERPSSSMSRNNEKQFHAASGKDENPSTYSTTSERQESYPKLHSESKHLETQVSRTGLDIQRAQPEKYKRETSLKIKTPLNQDVPTSDQSRDKSSKRRSVFTRMESMTGPLHVLTRCVQNRFHVRVMTRGAVYVKGICRGYIVAFDKHFNMAMIDVDEIYRRPPALGKVKARRSHNLLAAQETLQREREEKLAQWREEQEITKTSTSLQDLSIRSDVSGKDQKFLTTVLPKQEYFSASDINTNVDQTHPADQSSKSFSAVAARRRESAPHLISPKKELEQSERSVYAGLKAPKHPYEREALMLGIPDENVVYRHINQLFIRGENVVSVSIIEDF